MSKVSFRLTAGTNVGCVRTNNEDNFTVNPDLTKKEWFLPSDSFTEISLGEAGCLFVVADGMGGMNAGEVASDIAVKTIEEIFSTEDFSAVTTSSADIETFMKSAIEKADSNIKQRVKEDKSTSGMGTTIVVAWVIENTVHLAWCGDSRAYRFNKDSGLTQLTKDHSYVQQLVDEGKLDPELAFDHPHSNIITRSLGDTQSKVLPDYRSYELFEGDCVFLCTDGLCGICRDEQILATLNEQNLDDVIATRDALIRAALDEGGYDNVTVALFQVVQTDNKKEELTNTIIFQRKPLYKKSYIWVLLILLVTALFGMFAPDKWLGEKLAAGRGRLADKIDSLVVATRDTVAVKLDRLSQSKPTAKTQVVEESIAPEAADSLVETSTDSKTEALDDAYVNDYNQNSALRKHKTEKDKEDARRVKAEKDAEKKRKAAAAAKKAEAARKAAEAKKAEEARKAAEEAARKAEEAKKAEDAQKAEEAKKAEEARKAEEAQKMAEQESANTQKESASTEKTPSQPESKSEVKSEVNDTKEDAGTAPSKEKDNKPATSAETTTDAKK